MPTVESLVSGDARSAPDVFVLKDRLHELFSRYGQVSRLDLVRADQGSARRVMCFLRMGSPQQEQAVVQALGMGRFGGDLVMVLALEPQAWAAVADLPWPPPAAWSQEPSSGWH